VVSLALWVQQNEKRPGLATVQNKQFLIFFRKYLQPKKKINALNK
jgi:hypothetical protein